MDDGIKLRALYDWAHPAIGTECHLEFDFASA
jgi:hypothetical protein